VVSSHTPKAQTLTKYRCNPGNSVTFPWGSAVALGYESWVPLGMEIIYDSTSGDALNSADTSLGKVCMAIQYNTYNRDWDSFIELENANDSVCFAPSQSAILGIENKKALRGASTLYVSATDPNSAGKGFYDICDFYIATIGVQGMDVRLGDLKVRYRFKLFNPVVRDSEFPPLYASNYGTTASANDALVASTTNAVETFSSRNGGTVTWAANVLTITIRPLTGRARLVVQQTKVGSSVSRNAPVLALTCSILGVSATPTTIIDVAATFGAATAGNSAYTGEFIIPVNVDTLTLTFSGATGNAADVNSCYVFLMPYETSDF
jgi:hypothetical protein